MRDRKIESNMYIHFLSKLFLIIQFRFPVQIQSSIDSRCVKNTICKSADFNVRKKEFFQGIHS